MSIFFTKEPMVLNVELAEKIGLNEAIIMQQLHYWLQRSNHEYEGRIWVYNTYAGWHHQFPWWSEKTIQRTLGKLEDEGYVFSGNFNKLTFDKTKWYSVNYDHPDLVSNRSGQNVQTEQVNLSRPIPEITQRLQKHTSVCHDITEYEQKILDVLQRIVGYPFDTKTDLASIRKWVQKYSTVDVASVIEDYEDWRSGKVYAKKESPRGQINTFLKKESEKIAQRKSADSPPSNYQPEFFDTSIYD